MALKSKIDLKDVFGGVSSVLYQEDAVKITKGDDTNTATITPSLELPAEVDTLSMSQGDPSIQHYKVIGMDNDWWSTATSGDTELGLTVPTKHTDILKLCWGDDSVKEVSVTYGDDTFKGDSITLSKKKITGSLVLVNEEKNQLAILNNVALWATPLYDTPASKPFAVKLTGTMEAGDGDNIIFLKKQ